ncbi:hypothetical protein KEM48_004108 [Puccinia striiformis f. sp. tritici PST-130]|nr:hypothetical protein KEM48_004108 [Puccinia striiformis f. sp. tritici PST-130]
MAQDKFKHLYQAKKPTGDPTIKDFIRDAKVQEMYNCGKTHENIDEDMNEDDKEYESDDERNGVGADVLNEGKQAKQKVYSAASHWSHQLNHHNLLPAQKWPKIVGPLGLIVQRLVANWLSNLFLAGPSATTQLLISSFELKWAL